MKPIYLLAVLLWVSMSVGAELKKWTYLFYVAGDEGEIDPFSRVPIRKLEQLGSSADRWIVAHVDLNRDLKGNEQVSEPAYRYLIEKHPGLIIPTDYSTLRIQSSVVWSSSGETASSSAQQLEEFIRWSMERYPAEHYALFVLGHGWGWRGIAQDFNPGFEIPQNPAIPQTSYLMASLEEYQTALGQFFHPGRRLDLLVFDACNMGVMEVLYAFRNQVKTIIASATEMPFMSYDYVQSLSYSEEKTIIRALVDDALQSFGRGGSQVKDEGDYPSLSVFALDLGKMEPLWTQFERLFAEIRGSNFSTQFLGNSHSSWLDMGWNIDLLEFLNGLATHSNKEAVRKMASEILVSLGEPNPLPPPDSMLREVIVPKGTTDIEIMIQADELVQIESCLEKSQQVFFYLNPPMRKFFINWTMEGKAEGRVVKLLIPRPPFSKLLLRPFLPGASWAQVRMLRGNKVLQSHRWEEPQTYYVRKDFPAYSPYLISGHTFGAGRNHGMSLNLDPVINMTQPENHHFNGTSWIGGIPYYRTIEFAKVFGWADLLFSVP